MPTSACKLLQNASHVRPSTVPPIADVYTLSLHDALPIFSVSGSTLSVNTNNAAYDALKQGETSAFILTYDVVDEFGALVHQTATVTLTGTNDIGRAHV